MAVSIIMIGTLLTLVLLMFTVGGFTIFAGIKAKKLFPSMPKSSLFGQQRKTLLPSPLNLMMAIEPVSQ